MLGRRLFPFGAKGIFSGGHLLVLGSVCVTYHFPPFSPSHFCVTAFCRSLKQVAQALAWHGFVEEARRWARCRFCCTLIIHLGWSKRTVVVYIYIFPMPGQGLCQLIDPGYLHTFFTCIDFH